MHNLERYPWSMPTSLVPSSNRMNNRDSLRFGFERDIGRNNINFDIVGAGIFNVSFWKS